MPFRTKKSKIYQYDVCVRGSRFRGSCGTADYEEAKEVEAQVRADAKSQDATKGAFTLSQALGTYYRDKGEGTPSAHTTRGQAKAILKHMKGAMPLASITNADIMSFAAKDRATCANATVNRRLQMLGRAIRHMGKVYGAEIPDLDMKAAEAKEPRERVRELSIDEQHRLFEHLPTEYHPLVTFALLTGARIATICGLLWDDVDMAGATVFFRLKGGDVMTFPMSNELRALLSAQPRSNVLAHRRVVFTRVNRQTMERTPINPSGGTFGTAWRKALADAGIDDFRFHDLRHTFATRLLRQSRNLKLVSKCLGHTMLETTSRYAHVLVDDMRSELDVFSAVPQNFTQTRRTSD